VAVYQITKQDVAQANPEDTGPGDGIPALLNLGEVESSGVELTLVGDITDRLAVTANYAYNDVEVVDGVTTDSLRNTFGDGTRFANAPEHQFGIWMRYALPAINSSIAFGADHVSEQFSLSGQRVKPYTVYDASWTTAWNQVDLQINVRNLFDEEYAVSGFIERTGHFPGAPREVIAQLRYHF
jgi:iron complex outermembrane receptor protein